MSYPNPSANPPADCSTAGSAYRTQGLHRAVVEQAILRMRERLGHAWDANESLSALSREAGYSKPHYIRIFQELTGTTPHHFLASLRIQHAKELLLTTSHSVTDIALEVGYESFPTFSRTFTEYVGFPPSYFRQMPRTIPLLDLARAARALLSHLGSRPPGNALNGIILAPPRARGITFVGTFTRGVPQGHPQSGTILLRPGPFQLRHPAPAPFHLMAVFLPGFKGLMSATGNLPGTLVASCRVTDPSIDFIELELRPVRITDPPLVVALRSLLRPAPGNENSG